MTDNEEFIYNLKKHKASLKILSEHSIIKTKDYEEVVTLMIASLEEFNNEIEQLKSQNKELKFKIFELETKAKINSRIFYRKR